MPGVIRRSDDGTETCPTCNGGRARARDAADPPGTGDPYIDCETCAGTGRIPKGKMAEYAQIGQTINRVRQAYVRVMHAWKQRVKTPQGPDELQRAIDEMNEATAELSRLRNI
jgi:DnaJ-class molecular chaperone